MGLECCGCRQAPEADMGKINMETFKGNAYEMWEVGFPFYRTNITAFERRVRNAARLTAGAKELGKFQ